jgi:amino acid transporter
MHDDEQQLARLGYKQELRRRLGGFSNFAVSLSIICILAGGVTSFAQGFCGAGGAAIGIGWPLVTLFALAVAATMGQIASAFPTAGGLYHWAAILGGRGWGWVTAWFNLAGLIAVLAAINSGTVGFVAGALGLTLTWTQTTLAIAVVTFSHALFNHFGIRITSILTDFSGWLILSVSIILTIALMFAAPSWDLSRLVTFANFSGSAGGDVLPSSDSPAWLFILGFLLPAYTLTGYDASAHVAEETVSASVRVPRGIVRSVLISGVFGWAMLIAVVLAMPSLDEAAARGNEAFVWTLKQAIASRFAAVLIAGIAVAQYLCGLATVTSASRMAFAFARDGGLPKVARLISPAYASPIVAVWLVSAAAVMLAMIPYSAVAASAAVLLYISYVLPAILGAVAFNHTWTQMGPWQLGRWFRPLAVVAAIGCLGLLFIGMQPPNQDVRYIVAGMAFALTAGWFAHARRRFPGPPVRNEN